jgi:hypothetical protein
MTKPLNTPLRAPAHRRPNILRNILITGAFALAFTSLLPAPAHASLGNKVVHVVGRDVRHVAHATGHIAHVVAKTVVHGAHRVAHVTDHLAHRVARATEHGVR